MKQSWRWFGPKDPISLAHIVQAGATGIVTSLHHLFSGDVWTTEEIKKRQREISHFSDGPYAGSPTGLEWSVVESLVVSEDIKKQGGNYRDHYENYRTSLEHLAKCGVKTICYNFMPVIDWTRTDLAWRLPNGGTAMRFDIVDFAVFDIHLLKRAGAKDNFSHHVIDEAETRLQLMTEKQKNKLVQNIVTGLPGSNEKLSLDQVKEQLSAYEAMDNDRLASNLIDFLAEIIPTAERLGMRMCCHPDDPPFPLLGLPRVTSTAGDFRRFLDAVPSLANGMTYCTGSFGARHDNDMLALIEEFGPKIHFVHLRAVKRDSDNVPCSFFEDEHLGGDIDMVAIVVALQAEEKRRRAQGRADAEIPMRPDHGHNIVDDLGRSGGQPGYPVIGRLKGLAELRGVMRAVEKLV